MKNSLLGPTLLISSLAIPLTTEASQDFYLSIGGGVALPSDVEGDSNLGGTNYDATFETEKPGLFSVGFGKEFNDYRFEFNYSKATVESNKIIVTSGGTGVSASMTPNLKSDVNSYMFYGYRDFTSDSKLTPYGGIGLGTATLSAKNQTVTVAGADYKLYGDEKTVFSWGLKGGAAYEIAENTSIYSEASYQNFSSYQISRGGFATVNYDKTHYIGITAGLKFNF